MRFKKPIRSRLRCAIVALCCLAALNTVVSGQNLTLRIVTYNIEDDIGVTNTYVTTNNATTPLPGLIVPVPSGTGTVTNGGVLEGIGSEVLSDGVAQPIDILALQETSGPSSVNPIVAGLNAYYGVRNPLFTNMYAATPHQATESGGATNDGNGPNSIIYNTRTVQLLASVPVDPVGGTSKLGSSSGEYRETMRYEFAPAGQTPTAATEFYVYVSHYKSGTTSTDLKDRAGEAYIIRTNEAADLPVNARVLYVGDFNITTSGESSYQTIVQLSPTNGITQGQGTDPMNTSGANTIDWSQNSLLNMKSDSVVDLHYRDDLQVPTTNVYNGVAGGLALVASTYHVFANNGSVPYEQSIAGGADTALNSDLVAGSSTASQLYKDLAGAADHLPVVADYVIPVVPPVAAFTATPTNGAPPLAVAFTDDSSGIVTNWFWDFGDGATSNSFTASNAAHTYTNAGTYTVIETVTGPGGISSVTNYDLVTVLSAFQSWQLQYFGCTSCPNAQPPADVDGTGQNNYFKFVAGLNPTNPASVFVFNIADVTNSPSGVTLTYSPIAAGRTYTVLSTTNLDLPETWSPVFTSAPVTNGMQVSLQDTNALTGEKFYQIQISTP